MKMKQPSTQVLSAIRMMNGTCPAQFAIFCEWIKESIDERREANDSLEGVQLYRSQGGALTLYAMKKTLEDAPTIMEQQAGAAGLGGILPPKATGDSSRRVVRSALGDV